jgi:hypothetical protein
MVICIIGLFIFAILGSFSTKYRLLFKESYRCIFRMMTFRPCETKLDERIKARIVAGLMKRNPGLAKFTFKNFKTISIILTAVFLISMVGGVYAIGSGVYNYLTFGNCNGPGGGACIISETTVCTTTTTTASTLSAIEQACISSGGTVKTSSCCQSAGDFPNTCLIGACGCAPNYSHNVKVCDCGTGKCWDSTKNQCTSSSH